MNRTSVQRLHTFIVLCGGGEETSQILAHTNVVDWSPSARMLSFAVSFPEGSTIIFIHFFFSCNLSDFVIHGGDKRP